MLETVVDTKTVEQMIERERIARYNAGFFITRNLDIMIQNYAKVKFNKNFISVFIGKPL
jgi:hypothetical protein